MSVCNIDDNNVCLPQFQKRCNSEFKHSTIIASEITDLINSLTTNKASGPDNINHRLLKNISTSVASPLSLLYNMSINCHEFPSQWKIGHIIPIYKKGEHCAPSNYRPISLLSCVGKLFERLVFKRMHNYFIDNKLLCKYQSGFMPGHSTQFQLIEIYHQICMSLDKHEDLCMVFCDISKAFDRVWHKGLLFKLKQYGIPTFMIKWFQSYLTNRRQRVCVNSTLSSEQVLHAGVPQGSVLGPFLFLVYINDISEGLHCLTRLFADDTSIGSSSMYLDNIQDSINIDLNTLNNWAKRWLVNFNPNNVL